MKNCESILGKKILEIREQKGYSQQQLATKAGLSKALITHIETGKRYPSEKALKKIIEALEVSEDKILTEDVKNEFLKKIAEEAKPSEVIRAYRQIVKNDK
ncbi:MAG: helix-turn-helix transcriptional regulator [Brachyspira sp.]|jgi:transcription regulator|nr:helix-turn-helix transcriptional regulator [Brachyspira sp.]